MKVRISSFLLVSLLAGSPAAWSAPYVLDPDNPLNISESNTLDTQAPDGIQADGGAIIWDDATQNIFEYFRKTFTGEKKITLDTNGYDVLFSDLSGGDGYITNSSLSGMEITKTGQGTLTLGNPGSTGTGNGRITTPTNWVVQGGILELAARGNGYGYGFLSGTVTVEAGAQFLVSGIGGLGWTNDGNSNGRVSELTVNEGGSLHFSAVGQNRWGNATLNLNGGAGVTGVAANDSWNGLTLTNVTVNVGASDTGSVIGNLSDGNNTYKLFIREGTGTFNVENGAAQYDLTIAYLSYDKDSPVSQLIKNGEGTMYVARGAFWGETIVNGGTLRMGTGGGSSAIRGTLTINSGGRFEVQDSDAFGYSSTQNQRLGTLNIGGELYIDSTGNQTLRESVFNFTGGSVSGRENSKLGMWGATFNATANSTISDVLISLRAAQAGTTWYNTMNVSDGVTLTVNSQIVNSTEGEGATVLTKDGAGELLLTNSNNTYSMGTNIKAGSVNIGGSSGTIGSGNITMALGSKLVFSRTTNYTMNQQISGDGSFEVAADLTRVGTGTVTLGTDNLYTGGTVINGGGIIAASGQALGTGNVLLNGGTLSLSVNSLDIGAGDLIVQSGMLSLKVLANGNFQTITSTGDLDILGGVFNIDLSDYAGVDESYTFDVNDFFSGFATSFIDYSKVSISGTSLKWEIDGSGIATFSIPEPSSVTLLGLAGLLVAVRRRRS